MISIRRRSARVPAYDDGSGRIALIGIFVVIALLGVAIRLTTHDIAGKSLESGRDSAVRSSSR